MAKYYGKVGYGIPKEIENGVWDDEVTERGYYGDIIRNSRRLENDDKVNSDISVGNSISIVADAFAFENFFAIRYVTWMGARWIVSNVEVQHPRLVLRLGGVYNGPVAD